MWPFKKKQQVRPETPEVIFRITADGKLYVSSSWPRPLNDILADKIASDFALLNYLINSGKLQAYLQQSVGVYSNQVGEDFMGEFILAKINKTLEILAKQQEENNESPIVSPRDVFGRGPAEANNE